MTDSYSAIMERFKEIANLSKDSEVAEALGLSPQALSDRKRRSSVPYEQIVDYCREHGLDLNYVLTGSRGEVVTKEAGQYTLETPSHEDKDFVLIKRYDVRAAAGGGVINHEAPVRERLAFRRSWITSQLHADPDNLVLVDAVGDSMQPTIRQGDLLLVARTSEIQDEGIYVMSIGDRLVVKRVQLTMDGGIRVTSDNPAYADEELRGQEISQLNIVGRVVWIGRSVV